MSKPKTKEQSFCPECGKPWKMDTRSWPVRVLCKHCYWNMPQKSYTMGRAEWRWDLLVKREVPLDAKDILKEFNDKEDE